MSDTATRAAEALEELRSELAHADDLITQQQTRIEALEEQVTHLQARLNTPEGSRVSGSPRAGRERIGSWRVPS